MGMLQGRASFDSMLDLVSFSLTFALHCFCSLKGYSPYKMAYLGEPCPRAWILNQNIFVQDPVHLWISYRKEGINTSSPWDWLFHETYARLLLPHLPTSLFYKTTWHPDPISGYFETSVCHLLGLPACWVKLYSLSQHLIFRLIATWWANWAWTE